MEVTCFNMDTDGIERWYEITNNLCGRHFILQRFGNVCTFRKTIYLVTTLSYMTNLGRSRSFIMVNHIADLHMFGGDDEKNHIKIKMIVKWIGCPN